MTMGLSMYCRWIALASFVVVVVLSKEETSECGLWLAPSSVSSEDARKLGLFAGTSLSEKDVVANPELAIPLIDFAVDWNRRSEIDDVTISFLEGYMWTPEYSGAKYESDHSSVSMIPGHGVLTNYHSGIYNVDWSQGSVLLRSPPSVPRAGEAHPSRGAITPYYNLTMTATQAIPAGMELFANFGEVWEGNTTGDVFQERVRRRDYVEADKVLDQLLEFFDTFSEEMKPGQAEEILDFVLGKILATAAGPRAKAIRSLIPSHPGKLQTVKDVGGTFSYRNADLVKSPKWLAKRGTCVDNLESGPSTIPEAGRGAFAARKLAKGSTIAPMPLLQIPDNDLMDIYRPTSPQDDEPNFDRPPIGQQLVVNYCLGHAESSLLLLPVGPMVNFINHRAQEPNAKIQWSENKYWGNTDEWLDLPPYDLVDEENQFIGLVMEVVATRDIDKGEEVFIDYGDEWVAAWETYMKSWESESKDKPWSPKADDLKMEYNDKPFKTLDELRVEPYPEGVATICFVEMGEVEDGRPRMTDDGKDISAWNGPTIFEDYKGTNMFKCDILERSDKLQDGSYRYTVRDEELQVENVPHAAITFVDKPYQGDIHVKGAFRHFIGIPDSIFPQAWRDRR